MENTFTGIEIVFWIIFAIESVEYYHIIMSLCQMPRPSFFYNIHFMCCCSCEIAYRSIIIDSKRKKKTTDIKAISR